MKSRQDTLRVLLDTSFILPSLGVDVGGEVSEGLRKVVDAGAVMYYSTFSVLESLWVAARLSGGGAFDVETFSVGLRSVVEGGRYRKVEEDSRTFSEALRLYVLGHRDIVDNILYVDSTSLDLNLLTVDDELRVFIREKGLRDTLIFPGELG
ncbi:MAG: PIN domain-containing protein [Candidatus Bathyarchaeia archaeon]